MSIELDRKDVIELFETCFRHSGGAVKECDCGKVYYNPSDDWTWDEGEIESLEKSGATAVNYSVGDIEFGAGTFADACDCWHDEAMKLYYSVICYDRELAELLARRQLIFLEKAKEAATVHSALSQLLPAGADVKDFNRILSGVLVDLRSLEHITKK
jgi:hypothetical protein